MTRIQVSPELLLSVSDQFDKASKLLEMDKENLNRQIFMLMSNWDGQASTAFFSEFQIAYKQMDLTVEHMHVISQELKEIAIRFMNADQLQDFMGDQRMELFAKLSASSNSSEPPKSFIDQVQDTMTGVASGVGKGLESLVESLKDTGTAFFKNPIGTVGGLAYNATVGTAEDIIDGVVWGKDMIMDEAKREAFVDGTQESIKKAGGLSSFLGEQGTVLAGSFFLGRAGLKGGKKFKQDSGGDGGSRKEGIEGKREEVTGPTLPEGGKPKGKYETPDPNDPNPITLQNEAADLLASKGYDIEMLPNTKGGNGYGIKSTSNPDFFINGKAFDCYSPETPKVRNIWATVVKKTEEQANGIIMNLDGYKGSMDDLYQQFNDYDVPNLEELIIIKDGKITRLKP